MQGPAVDIVLLLLLILFFGRQQRNHPRVHYRMWFIGWIVILASYSVWEIPLTRPAWVHIQNALRFDLMLCGLLIFLTSFVSREKRLWEVLLSGLWVGVPVVLVMNLTCFVVPVPRWMMMLGIVAWQMYGARAAHVLLPRGRIRTRLVVFGLCLASATLMSLMVAWGQGDALGEAALSEVLLGTAVLYGGGLERRSLAVGAGIAGFIGWASFYMLGNLLPPHSAFVQHFLYVFWNVPKYFVGFSMILKVFEDNVEENGKLATKFQTLYEEFRELYSEHPHPMWVYAPEDGSILSANAAAVARYGFSEEEFLTMSVSELEVRDEALTPPVDGLFSASEQSGVLRHRCKDGRLLWADATNSSVLFRGREARLLQARDITEQIDVSRALAHKAHHDMLTGLPNRSLFGDRVQQCLARCDRDGRKAVLLTIDVDYFKRINDTFGHPTGDVCLQMVAGRLASKIRQVDTIARIGGEEFAAVVGGLHHAADARKVSDSLLEMFTTPLLLAGREVKVTVSIGAAIYPDDASDEQTLKVRSDEALYAAKHGGRNRAVFVQEMHHAALPGNGTAQMEALVAAERAA